MKWRLDDSYPEACEEIRKKCYPQEIIDLYPTSDAKPATVKQWFMNTAHVGEAAASKQASFYLLLTEADPTKTAEVPKTSNSTTPKKPEKPTSKPAATDTSKTEMPTPVSPPAVPAASNFPALHIDVQIHIAPDTSAEQIDRIFASMAKHFKGMKGDEAE